MIIFKKTFDFYATDVELETYVHSILDTVVDDPEADVAVEVDSDTDNRYVLVSIFDKVLH